MEQAVLAAALLGFHHPLPLEQQLEAAVLVKRRHQVALPMNVVAVAVAGMAAMADLQKTILAVVDQVTYIHLLLLLTTLLGVS